VPAVTFIPSESFAFANCLASLSVGNDFVRLTEGDREETGPCCFRVRAARQSKSLRPCGIIRSNSIVPILPITRQLFDKLSSRITHRGRRL